MLLNPGISDRRKKERKQGLIIRLVPDITITLLIIAITILFHVGIVGSLLLCPALLLFFVGVPVFSIIFFRQAISTPKIRILILLSMVLLVFLSLLSVFRYIGSPNFFVKILLFPIITMMLGIITNIILLRSKDLAQRLLAIRFLFFLTILLTMVAPLFFSETLPYLYTPPAITAENLAVYNQCVRFLKIHDDYESFKLNRRNWISLEGASLVSDEKKYFSKNEIIEIRRLREELFDVKCQQFQRDNDMVLFYKIAACVVPTGPGVVYSLSGKNPNEIDSEVLSAAKPFIKITGDWYMSKHLMLRGPRLNTSASVPKSLIDHSLKIDGIDPNNLHEFD